MEARPNMIKKYNKPIYGFIIGIILPIIAFFVYYLVKYIDTGIDFESFIFTLEQTKTFIPILSLCVLPNLIAYFVFKKFDYWYAIKGLVLSILLYTVLVIVLKFM